MNHTNYSLTFEYLKDRLEKEPKPLANDKITQEIQNLQGLFQVLSSEQLSIIIGRSLLEDFEPLEDEELATIEEKLKTLFNVQQERGIAISSTEVRDRSNTEWWSMGVKPFGEMYHWNRYKKFISEDLPYRVVKTMDDDTDIVMDLLENPKDKEEFSVYGMVVGHVQSGKTANYSALIAKAADAGYKFIVVIAGALNNLRNQTQERLNYSFIGRDDGKINGVGNFSNSEKSKMPISLTTKYVDFNKQDANQEYDLDMGDRPVIMVIKKNGHTLSNVISWLKSHYTNGVDKHSMLLIDDESDYASVNTKAEEDPTSINRKIRELLGLFSKSAYVAYTATPYANIFIDYKAQNAKYGEDLFPRDFIYALAAPSNYFGAERIFLNSNDKYFNAVTDYEDVLPFNHKKTLKIESLPESLEEAVRHFVLNIAIRHLRRHENKHNSMMIHVTRFTDVHKEVYYAVSEYLETELQRQLELYGKVQNPLSSPTIASLKETLDKNYSDLEFSWEEILNKMIETTKTITVQEVHKDSVTKLVYPEDQAVNYIVVGGTSLARGYTLEGLSVSYFLRNTIFYDTLMQMGRWFGYRTDYEDLCRIYTTHEIFERFQTIILATIDLLDSLKKMNTLEMTPQDFGLAVQQHPDSGLQVTARNKSRETQDIIFEMCLDGHLKETSWLDSDKDKVKHNIQVIKETIMHLLTHEDIKDPEKLLWTRVDKKVVANLFNQFKFFGENSDEFGIYSRMPVQYVRQYVEDIDTSWDFYIATGSSKTDIVVDGNVLGKHAKRKVDLYEKRYEFRNRQVSSGSAEEVALSNEQIKKLTEISKEKKIQEQRVENGEQEEVDKIIAEFSRRKEARAMLERPLIILHLIESDIIKKGDTTATVQETVVLPAISVSFPSTIESGNKNIKLRVNSVYLDKVLNDEQQGDDDVEDE